LSSEWVLAAAAAKFHGMYQRLRNAVGHGFIEKREVVGFVIRELDLKIKDRGLNTMGPLGVARLGVGRSKSLLSGKDLHFANLFQ
jgi:hypothetical protein